MPNKKQKISVIVPVYNDPEGLKDTLNSLVKQDYPENLFEVIVADNGSTEKTLALIDDFIARHPKLIRKVQEKNIQSSYAARNKGINEAKGKIIAFIDADMTVEKDWLRKISQSLLKHHTDCLVCNLHVINGGDSLFALYDSMVAFPIKTYVKKSHYTPAGCLVIYKEIFNKMGVFDSNLISGGDREFGNRIYNAGYQIRYEPDIVMKHPVRHSPKKLLSKAFRIGRGYKQMNFYYPHRYKKKYKNILNPRNLLPKMSIFIFTRAKRGNKIWDQASSLQKILFYLIYWLKCISNYCGYCYETLFLNKQKTVQNLSGETE